MERTADERVQLLLYSCAFVCLLGTGSASAELRLDSREVAAALRAIAEDRLKAHTRFLADDLLEGRGTGTRGHEIAARYVAAQFEAVGLRAPLGRYLHSVRIRTSQVHSARTTLTVQRRDGSARRLVYETDFVVAPDLLERETSLAAEVVFAGYCVSAPELRYDDFKNADLRGKLVACLRGAPSSFTPVAQAEYSRFEPKLRSIASRGAVGLVDVRTAESEAYFPWTRLVENFRRPWVDWLTADGKPARAGPVRASIVLAPAMVGELFSGAPMSLAEAKALAGRGDMKPFALGVTLQLHQQMHHQDTESPNVLGLLPGSDSLLGSEYVVYVAHVDHLGVGPPVNKDTIYNGASDNASGTAALIEVARAFASMPTPPRRSLLFVGTTGEEAGLVGSDFFVRNPPVPPADIVAAINIDGIAATHPALADVIAISDELSTLGDDARRAAEAIGLKLTHDPAPERLYSVIGEHYSFVKAGIPAVWLISGDKSSDPSVDVPAFKRRWSTTIYHTPADDMMQSWSWSSASRFARAQFLIGYIVGNRTKRPAWKHDDDSQR